MKFNQEGERIYIVDETGNKVAEITMPVANGVADITDTYVEDSLRGQGVASKLMETAVSKARDEKLKLKLTCPYAVKWFERHQEHFDLLYWSCDSNRV